MDNAAAASTPPTSPPAEGWPTVAVNRRRVFGGRQKLIARPLPFPGLVENYDASVSIEFDVIEEGSRHTEAADLKMTWAEMRQWATGVLAMCDEHEGSEASYESKDAGISPATVTGC